MPYRRPQAYARKDLLTPGGYNQLGRNARLLDQAFRAGHSIDGEHNSANIARTVGTVERDGSFYELLGFDGDVTLNGASSTPFGSVANPVAGKVLLTLPASRFSGRRPVLVQNASETGATLPCLTSANWLAGPSSSDNLTEILGGGGVQDPKVEVYSTYWNGTLGVAGSGQWEIVAYGGGEDASFHLLAHGPRLPSGNTRDFGAPLLARQGMRADGNSYTNVLIQGSADLEAELRVEHTAGVHDARPIPKAWAHVQWSGSRYTILDQHCLGTFGGGRIASVEIGDTSGRVDVTFAAPMVNRFFQTFVQADFPRVSGAATDIFIACAPLSYQTAWGLSLFLYKKLISDPGGQEYFERNGACDFHVWIYDDHGTV